MTGAPALAARALSRRFGDTWALREVSLEVAPGEAVALVGPNGAGKSTLLSLAAGTLLPSDGEVRVGGGDPAEPAIRAGIGLLPQETLMVEDEGVEEQLALWRSMRGGGGPEVGALLEAFGLAGQGGRPWGALSAGYRRRAELAAALCGAPALLLLDEPLASLDAALRPVALERVRALAPEAALVVASHAPEEAAQVCTREVRLEAGRVVGA